MCQAVVPPAHIAGRFCHTEQDDRLGDRRRCRARHNIADSGGSSVSGYKDWHNANYGTISVKQFAKPRIARALHGKICAAVVTPGRADDSSHLRGTLDMVPHGSGDVWPTPNAAESKTARRYRTVDAAP